jgi:hypothetical protein
MIRIANAQFWVHDQDEAVVFYTKTLGWEVRADVTVEAWNFRWLSVGPGGQDGMGLVLMPIPGPPMLDDASSAHLAELVAKGAGGPCFLRPTIAKLLTTSSRPEESSSTIRRLCSLMASTRRFGTPRAITSDSPRCSSSKPDRTADYPSCQPA